MLNYATSEQSNSDGETSFQNLTILASNSKYVQLIFCVDGCSKYAIWSNTEQNLRLSKGGILPDSSYQSEMIFIEMKPEASDEKQKILINRTGEFWQKVVEGNNIFSENFASELRVAYENGSAVSNVGCFCELTAEQKKEE